VYIRLFIFKSLKTKKMEPKEPFMPQQEPSAEKKEEKGELVIYPDGTTEYAKDPQEAAEKMRKWREER